MSKPKLIIFLSSTRVGASYTGTGAWGDKVGTALAGICEAAGFSVSVWDPKEPAYPVLVQPLHLVPDNSGFPEWMHKKKAELEAADAFAVCSAEYNSSLPPALTNMLDHYPPAAYKHRPVGMMTYSVGKLGGVRVQPALKTLVTELGMVPVPACPNIAEVGGKFGEDGELNDDSTKKYLTRLACQLKWYSGAIREYKINNEMPE